MLQATMSSLVKSTNVRMAKAQFAVYRGSLQRLSRVALLASAAQPRDGGSARAASAGG